MIDLNGTYTHNVDAKGRVSLPAKFRKKLPLELIVTPSLDNESLYVFDEDGFNEWVASFFERDGGYDPRSVNHINLRSVLKGRAVDVAQDSAGRINLPASQRELAGISKEVTLVGNTGYFEIWDAKRRADAFDEIDLSSFLHA